MVETKLLLVSLVLLAVSGVLAQDKPNIPNVDRIRLAEAFRLGEAESSVEGLGQSAFCSLARDPRK